jgi:hypothetical protein
MGHVVTIIGGEFTADGVVDTGVKFTTSVVDTRWQIYRRRHLLSVKIWENM